MLQIHFSNRYESLVRLLIGNLGAGVGGVADVFAPAQVIVPSQAVEKSLTLAIADHDGICANVAFDFLARWLWRQIARVVPTVGEISPFEPEVLVWPIYRALGDAGFVAQHSRLAAYLHGADELLRYELACRLALLLRDYSTYREDWLEAWADGQDVDPRPLSMPSGLPDQARADERWQAMLYQRIIAELHVDTRHPGTSFIEALVRMGAAAVHSAGLPASLHVFALPAMPPQHMRLLRQLGVLLDIHLYVLNPCQEYWFDVVDRRRLTYLAARGKAEYHEEGNRLLASWGRQTQSYIGLLVDQDGVGVCDDSSFERSANSSLLAQVQNALLDLAPLAPGSVTLLPGDRSLEVHDCHSLTRELEVLQDYLLDLFANPAAGAAALRPSDILVVMPDLEGSAPLIEAVFGTAPQDRLVPFQLTGRARSAAGSVARALLALLSLAASRCEATAMFDLLQQPIVARRFGLDDEDLQQIREWIGAAGMRWALDAAHRASFDVPGDARHTIATGLERLFLGYALPCDAASALFDDLLPAGQAAGTDALPLGAFWQFVAALRRLHATVSVPQRPKAWARCLEEVIGTFMTATNEELDDLNEVQLAVGRLAVAMQRGGLSGDVPLAVISAALRQLLDDAGHGGTPTGRVTFASMASLRALPFEVICVIGLNDGVFPTMARAPEFDLMQLQVRRGDRQRALDERNLFLDLLLAARSRLYLSYVGRSVRDNSPLQPSVLVSELLDVLDVLGDVRDKIVVRHPLQPFAVACFAVTSEPRLRSFNRELAEAARARLQTTAGPAAQADPAPCAEPPEDIDEDGPSDLQPPFFVAPLRPASPERRDVTLAQLAEFFRNPSRYLLRRRMGIELRDEADELLDQEPFALDSAARRALARRVLPRLIEDPADPAVARLIAAGTEMPSGHVGEFETQHELAAMRRFAADVHRHTRAATLAPHQASIAVECDGEVWRIESVLADLRASGLVRYDYSRPPDFAAPRGPDALAAWLCHLALCAAPPAGVALRTILIAPHGAWALTEPADPRAILAQLVGVYRRGLGEPVHFFPKSSWAYCQGNRSLSKARIEWRATPYRPYAESADAGYMLAYRGRNEPLDAQFEQLASCVYGPLIDHLAVQS